VGGAIGSRRGGGYTRELDALDYVPSADRRVPAAIELTALYVDRYRHFLTHLHGELIHIVAEDFEADLAGVLRAERLEDVFLYLPGVASLAGTRAQGEYLDDFTD